MAATQWNRREKPRSAHRGKAGRFIAAASVIMFSLLPLRAGDVWYNSRTEPWKGDRIIARQTATVIDANPGVLDDPACRGLVVAQIKAQNQIVADWMVEYNRTFMLPDNLGGANVYHVTNRKNGQVWEIIVALHSEQVVTK